MVSVTPEKTSAPSPGAYVSGKSLRHRNVPAYGVDPQEAAHEAEAAHKAEPSTDAKEPEQIKKAATDSHKQRSFWLLYLVLPLALTGAALFTRLYRIGDSKIVVWDEAHFGKFASYYLRREFYFDVHPPLGKMLNGLAGYLAGYDGTFEFESGSEYPESVDYVFMRCVNAVFGALTTPLAFFTALDFGMSVQAATLASALVLCDNSFATISRFILLDSMLLFFSALTMFCLGRFHAYRNRPFSLRWHKWMLLTGASMGCVLSVKWIGLFIIAVVGAYTVDDLWAKLADYRMPKMEYARHVLTRVGCFIVTPLAVYAFMFWLHFNILENSGPGDAQMSSLFQANLRGSSLRNAPLEVVIGSRVTIKNSGYGGGLLHSHVQTFPEGSQQQQITCYHHKDANNDWFFYPSRYDPEFDAEAPGDELRYIGHGDKVRLIHALTGRNLHSHNIAAPVTKAHWEVSGYGNLTVGDEKDHWIVEVVDDINSRDHSRIRTLTTTMRFRHETLGCYLRAANVNLPQWGWRQIEVTCDPENSPSDRHTHWNVESHTNDRLPLSDAGAFRSSFIKDFMHLNVAMWTSNNALIPDPDKLDLLASQPWQWPLASISLRMCNWADDSIKFLMVGNPVVYWLVAGSIAVMAVGSVVYALRWQRKCQDLSLADFEFAHYACGYTVLAWALHYLPFYIMGRVLYIHHYEPALYFGILSLAAVFDHVTLRILRVRALTHTVLVGVLIAAAAACFILLLPATFGMHGPSRDYKYMHLNKKWNLYD